MHAFGRLVRATLCTLLWLWPGSLPSALPAQTPPPAAAAASPTAVERPLLWRIEGPVPSYLFGTIHLPDLRVTKLGPTVQAAMDAGEALFTELPMELGEMMKMQSRVLLPKGQTLADVLGAELYQRLATYVTGKGGKMAMFDRVQPWAAVTQVALLDQAKDLATKLPLDMQLYDAAKKAKKVVGGLETFDEQFAVFGDLTLEEQRSMVASTLEGLEEDQRAGVSTTEKLLAAYLRGEEAALDALMNEFKIGDPKLRAKLMQRLLGDRNLRMADRIVRLLQEHPARCHVFAVGAAHYVGTEGLIALLGKRGYRITRLDTADAAVAAAREAEALDAEIARRADELEQLRARRNKLQPAGSGR